MLGRPLVCEQGRNCVQDTQLEAQAWKKINLTYLLKQDTGLDEPDIKTAMLGSSMWRAITVRANVST